MQVYLLTHSPLKDRTCWCYTTRDRKNS